MNKYYCNGKKGFCHKGDNGNADCTDCEYFNGKGGKIVETESTETELTEIELTDMDKWVITENGCVITCPKCGERLELCYPDGTEVRYLPYCPYCGKKLAE